MITFTSLPLAPEDSRAARAHLGLSQKRAAEESGLDINTIKRFEVGNYVPKTTFLEKFRAFFEGQGYQFPDAVKPGTRAKETGLVFPAAVVGEPAENQGSPSDNRPKAASFHHMRIALTDETEMGRILDQIEANEDRTEELLRHPVETSVFGLSAGSITESSQAVHAEALKLLAENGTLFARLFGRQIGGKPKPGVLNGTAKPEKHADLLHKQQAGMHLAMGGDRDAQAKSKQERKTATSLTSAIFG